MAIVTGTCVKDPQETRLFKMDWSAPLGTDTITSSSWVVPAGLTITANGVVSGNTKTYVILSGGEAGKSYTVTNTVVTSNTGETWQRSGRLDVRQY